MLKNVIIVCDCAHILGGIENVAFSSAKELVKQNINVYLFTSQGPVDQSLIDSGIHVICLNQYDMLSNPNRLLAVFQGLYNRTAYIRFENFLMDFSSHDTIVHFHSWTKALSSSLFYVTAKRHFKIVITLHDYFTVCPNGGFYNYQKKHICSYRPMSLSCIMCNCDARSYYQKIFRIIRQLFQCRALFCNKEINIISISNQTEKVIIPFIEKKIKRWFYLRNPVVLKKTTKVAIEKNDAYLFIARLSRENGAELFCQALTDLNLKGYVLGDGELMKELKEKYPKIVFCGWVDGEEKEKFILKGKGLIFPSLWYEGSPLTILEMKSCGIPCIVPDKCAASEDIKDGFTGFVFQTGSLYSLKKAIMKYEKVDLSILQKNIISTFDVNDYTPENHTINLINIYTEILNE